MRAGVSFSPSFFHRFFSELNSEKNDENWPTFAEVIVNIRVDYFFLRHGNCRGADHRVDPAYGERALL